MRFKMFITTVLMSLVLTACQSGLSEGEVRAIAADETAKRLEALLPELVGPSGQPGPQGAQGEVGPQGPSGTSADPDVILPTIKSEGFQLVDEDGVVRAALHMFAGRPQLDLFGADQFNSPSRVFPLASLALDLLSSDGTLSLRRSDGTPTARQYGCQTHRTCGDRDGRRYQAYSRQGVSGGLWPRRHRSSLHRDRF